jgi:ssDNA-binding Zn-finger/Zn-ribbon topoisomerase 1
MAAEPSRRFRPEACQKCGLVTRELKQAEINGKWYYACPECRGFKKADEKETRRARLEKLYAKELR